MTKPEIFLDLDILVRRNLTTKFEMTYGSRYWEGGKHETRTGARGEKLLRSKQTIKRIQLFYEGDG